MGEDERIMLQNPNTGRNDMRIRTSMYGPVRRAILEALLDGDLTNAQLAVEVEARTPAALWVDASLLWYTTSVKLHLEATGLLMKRGRPQVLSITDLGRASL